MAIDIEAFHVKKASAGKFGGGFDIFGKDVRMESRNVRLNNMSLCDPGRILLCRGYPWTRGVLDWASTTPLILFHRFESHHHLHRSQQPT